MEGSISLSFEQVNLKENLQHLLLFSFFLRPKAPNPIGFTIAQEQAANKTKTAFLNTASTLLNDCADTDAMKF